MRLLTKSFPSRSARLGNLAFVPFIILGVEWITLGRVGRITVLPIKCPQIWARVQLLGTLYVYDGLELVEVDVGEEGEDSNGDRDNKEILEQTIEKSECVSTPIWSKLGTQPIREWASEHLLEICGVA